jgi:PhnB protein
MLKVHTSPCECGPSRHILSTLLDEEVHDGCFSDSEGVPHDHAAARARAGDGGDRVLEAIAFYEKAFGAEVHARAMDPSGTKIWHAHLQIGSSAIFVNHVFPEMDPGAKQSVSNMWLYVDDVDASYKRAVDAGATPGMPPADMFWGDRMGTLVDPFGQRWTVATHTKDMTPEEIASAEAAFVASMKK